MRNRSHGLLIIRCPVCGVQMEPLPGHPQMPASWDFMKCSHCDFSVHITKLSDDQDKLEVAQKYIKELNRLIADGDRAREILAKIRSKT